MTHLDSDQIRALGTRVVDRIAEEFCATNRRPVFPSPQSLQAMEELFGGSLPMEGTDPSELLTLVLDQLLAAAGNPNHPGSMGYVLTSSMPLPALVESLVAAVKLRPTTWKNQPASCHIETTVIRWLGEMVGLSSQAAGYMTTGGSWANLAAVAVARVRKAGWDIRSEGALGGPQLVAYASEHTHSCVQRSCELLGIGSKWLRKIGLDSGFRLRTDLLSEAIEADIAAGLRPFLVVGNAGTVETGAIDPLTEISAIARRFGMWFHVDGAYGAFGALSDSVRPLLSGIALADSLTVDPHKWLNTPFEAGCVLFRDWDDLRATFSLVPTYLAGAMGLEHNQYEYGFELSRTDRALKVWLALRQHGVRQFAELVSSHIALARYLADLVRASDDFELVVDPELSICCFRFVPGGTAWGAEYLDSLNFDIEMALMRDGRGLVSGTVLNGRRVLRACIASSSVTRQSVLETFQLLGRIGRRINSDRSKSGDSSAAS